MNFSLLLLAWFTSNVAAQGSLTSAIGQLPSCALNCLVKEIAQSPCAITEQTCVCTNVQLQSSIEVCVLQACTIEEGLVTKNVTMTTCGVPARNHSKRYTDISNTLAVISAAFVLARLIYKMVITMAELGLDDLFIFIALISGVPSSIITVQGTVKNGLGRDIWTLKPSQITNFGKFFYVMAFLYFAQIILLKMSLLFFFRRIFPGRRVRRVIWATIAFNAVFGSIFVLLAIFQCRPISYFWTKWDGKHKGQCISLNAISWSNAAISISLDFWMLGIPLFQLAHLKMSWKKKASVALMFCVGTFVTVVSILRLQTLVHFADTLNPTWDFLEVSIWSTVEINIGIMCACMPAIRVILVRLFPKVLGSTRNTINQYKYGSRSHGDDGQGSRTPHTNLQDNAITYIKTFEIRHGVQHGAQHGESDEVSLVQLEDFGSRRDRGPKRSNASEEMSL